MHPSWIKVTYFLWQCLTTWYCFPQKSLPLMGASVQYSRSHPDLWGQSFPPKKEDSETSPLMLFHSPAFAPLQSWSRPGTCWEQPPLLEEKPTHTYGNGNRKECFTKCTLQCTEGWECDLGFQGLEIFFCTNGLGGFLGPKWKVFHHGTLRNHSQGVSIALGSRPGGEKMAKIRWKINLYFCPLKCAICDQSW